MEERRDAIRRPARALIAALALGGAAEGCELPQGARAESASFALSFRLLPERIALGEHESAVPAKRISPACQP